MLAESLNPLDLPLAEGLYERGWVVVPGFLSPQEVTALRVELVERSLRAELTPAGVGQGDEHQMDRNVRRDRTRWLEGDTPAQQHFLARMEQLRLAINRRLFLGLFDLEAHFAHYPPGAFYRRHRDAFRDSDARVVSAVCYLNEDWQAGEGGELVLWPQPRSRTVAATVLPQAGTLVCFLSEQVPHEVLPTQRDRYSIAGWFRRNTSIDGRVDPAG
ncbi:MAG: 2OG-Fe(II) oxygenase [Gammaproteobacteria bacterium]|nr:MAG: 2OG-Fe(II) oxygenase [Gammaproteobacteria bacterium]